MLALPALPGWRWGIRAVDFFLFEETEGLSAVFAVAAAFMFPCMPFLRRIGATRSKPSEETAI